MKTPNKQIWNLKTLTPNKEQKCLHDSCPECKGTGIKKDKTPCIHMISCPCSKCNATFLK